MITGSAQAVIPRSDIRRVVIREPDPLANGILIGVGIGALGMGLYANQPDFDHNPLGVFLVAAIRPGFGALAGWSVDASNGKDAVLYQAP